ncbi:MAG: sugar phosphate isomerase/epimerase family protein [Candidatus Hydrogenedentales bacterium]|jgi:sugar phosphate isomerase/epimerase
MRNRDISRRKFLHAATASGAALLAGARVAAQEKQPATPSICVFSKHLHFLDYAALAKTCKELRLDGIDLTVREGGHVEPDRVASDLPEAVEAIRAEGLDVPMITTALKNGREPEAGAVLEAASKLKIPYFRFGPYGYSKDGQPFDELSALTEELRGIAELAAEHKMTGGYHNHSGQNYVGAPLWDLHHLLTDVDSDSVGSNFDVGHATVEGGLGVWQINARLMAPRVKMLAVKDFAWENKRVRWLTLGEGQVPLVEFLTIFRAAGFSGPISLHFEYKTASNETLLEEIRKAVVTLRAALKEAGYA